MAEYAKSKDLHKTLRSVWDRDLKPLGYKRCKGSVAAYYRPRLNAKAFIRFWSQASQWGDSWSGNEFTINVDITISDPHSPFGGSDRCLGRVHEEDLEIAERIVERIINRKPKPPADHWVYNEMAHGENQLLWKNAFERSFSYKPGSLRPKTDIWLPYFSIDDVREWADFLSPRLPKLLDEIEKTNEIFG